MTVHALLGGFPLCLNPEVAWRIPKFWPEDHFWVGCDEIEHITCQQCKEQAERRKNEKEQTRQSS